MYVGVVKREGLVLMYEMTYNKIKKKKTLQKAVAIKKQIIKLKNSNNRMLNLIVIKMS
jgi:hypothetical protein